MKSCLDENYGTFILSGPDVQSPETDIRTKLLIHLVTRTCLVNLRGSEVKK